MTGEAQQFRRNAFYGQYTVIEVLQNVLVAVARYFWQATKLGVRRLYPPTRKAAQNDA